MMRRRSIVCCIVLARLGNVEMCRFQTCTSRDFEICTSNVGEDSVRFFDLVLMHTQYII